MSSRTYRIHKSGLPRRSKAAKACLLEEQKRRFGVDLHISSASFRSFQETYAAVSGTRVRNRASAAILLAPISS